MRIGFKIKGDLMGRKHTKKCIASYRQVGVSTPPVTQRIPLDHLLRERQWGEFLLSGIELPEYDQIIRDKMNSMDLRILHNRYWERYEYRGGLFLDTYEPGYITDGASVPTMFVLGSLTKDGQHIEEPAHCHDKDFADHVFSKFDSNCLFRGRIELQEHRGNTRARKTKGRYMLGVNSPTGSRLYNESEPGTNWMQGFYHHKILREMEW